MQIKVVSEPIQKQAVDAVILYLFENISLEDKPSTHAGRAINEALGGAVQELITNGDFTGKSGQVATLYPRGAIAAKRVILIGMGRSEQFNVDALRIAAAAGIKKARDFKAVSTASALPGTGTGGLNVESAARAITEGSLLGLYAYHGQKTADKPAHLPETLTLVTYESGDIAAAEQGVNTGIAIASGANLTRDLVNLPPNICTPIYLAQTAREIAETVNLHVDVLEEQQIRALRMGAFLAVAQGSDTPPRFIILEHNADKANELDTVVLVGKGVTFDTGGYDVKTADGMSTMKCDMAGAAAVLGAMRAIGELNLPLHVVGLVPTVDNMISGHAYRPQEVFTASNGKTIEVINTDAEGRMLLADALVYAGRYNPSAVVDIATLTGACVVALGSVAAGLFTTDATLRDILMSAGTVAEEKVWPMPLFPEYEKLIESQTADVKHTGGRSGGASIAATFLRQFVSYPAWAHVDMAGMAVDMPGKSYVPDKGASGYGVRLLTEFAVQWAQRNKDKE
jgi:leucyl aminopeptidase